MTNHRVSYLLTDRIGVEGRPPDKKPDRLSDLAQRVDRLRPCPRDPDRFHEEKSDIAAALRRLADEVRHG